MRLTGWTWLIAGVIVSVLSGYVYLFIPKNGSPNMSMAVFFFIGIIFIAVGIAKIFFRRMDDQSVMDSLKTVEEPQPKTVTTQTIPNSAASNIESKPNRIDETIAQMIQEEQQSRPQVRSQAAVGQINNINPNMPIQNTQRNMNHTNSFSKIYEYKGPVHNAATGSHTQHPVSQHIQQPNATHHTSALHNAPQHPVQNTTEHSIKCTKCGNANPGSANYCHKCGNRLK